MAESRRHLQALVPAGDRGSMLACDGAIADARLRCCDPCRGQLLAAVAAVAAQICQRGRDAYIAWLIAERDDLADQLSEFRLDGHIRVLAGYVEVDLGENLGVRDGVERYLELLAVITSSRDSAWP